MDFKDALKIVLDLEGGDQTVAHPKDPGGLTKFGISLRAHPELGVDGIIHLTLEAATEIYLTEYWEPLKLERLPPRLSLPLFDAAVNHGRTAAVEILQRSLNKLGANLRVDGILGKKTIEAANFHRLPRVLVSFLAERLEFYESLETYNIFGFGWIRRIMTVAISA